MWKKQHFQQSKQHMQMLGGEMEREGQGPRGEAESSAELGAQVLGEEGEGGG